MAPIFNAPARITENSSPRGAQSAITGLTDDKPTTATMRCVIPKVKKVINDPENLVEEVLDGLVLASRGRVTRAAGSRVLVRDGIEDGKVGLVIGGGSGHEPMYTAYVGAGLADASVAGNIFAAPAPQHVHEAIQAADRGKGVLLLYGN